MVPYIGITGLTTPREVHFALNNFPAGSRKLMVGVLASWKTVRGIPLKPRWAKQFPDPQRLSDLLRTDPRVLNLVHYSTDEGQESSLFDDLITLHNLAGPELSGFQLNIAWPPITLIEAYRLTKFGRKSHLILQLGQRAVEVAGGTTKGVVKRLMDYEHLVDAVLLDPSGGLGQAFDTQRARQFLRAIAETTGFGLGAAGGLGPDSLNLVEPLLDEFPGLNIDAQGQLRDENYNLDLQAVRQYLQRSVQMFSRY